MTEIERKVKLVVEYIHARKGVYIGDINLKDGKDLAKLNFAYQHAYNFFYSQ